MFKPLSVSAPAKLNLFLHITGRRPDGYHELQTLFQLLDYGDELHFAARADEQVTLSPALPGVAHDDNLITRAAHMLWPYRTVPCGVHISLTKRLPLGGGLGGGSSDAASTLVALNHLWRCGRRSEEHTSELQSRPHLVCRLLLEKKKHKKVTI